MRIRSCPRAVLLFLFVLAAGTSVILEAQTNATTHIKTKPTASAADEAAIRKIISDATEAWNRGDAHAFSRNFQEDGWFTSVLGMVLSGRKEFEQRHAEMLAAGFKGSRVARTIRRMRFLRPDVALADVDTEMTGFAKLPPGLQTGPDGALRARLQAVFVKDNGAWQIAALHNVDVKPVPQM